MPIQIPCWCMMQSAVSSREETAAWRRYDQPHAPGPTRAKVWTRSKGKPLLSGWALTSGALSSDQMRVSHPWWSCAFAKLNATVPTPNERRLTLELRCTAVGIVIPTKTRERLACFAGAGKHHGEALHHDLGAVL